MYDAARVTDELATQLRDEVDLEELSTAVTAAVTRTVQPTQVTLVTFAPVP